MDHQLASSNLAYAFEALSGALSVLIQRIEDESPRCFVVNTQGNDHLRALCDSLTDLWHEDFAEDGRETSTWPGLVAASPALCADAMAVNSAKSRLADAIADLWRVTRPHWRKKPEILERHASLQVHRERRARMRNVQMGRLSAKAACRHIVIVGEAITRAKWSWSRRTRSFRTYTAESARNRLLRDEPDDSRLVKMLNGLPWNELLVKEQLQPPHLRVNLWLASGTILTRRAQLPTFLPQEELPEFILPEPRPNEDDCHLPAPRQRSDRLLQDDPFIAGLQLYRYRLPRFQARNAKRPTRNAEITGTSDVI